MALAMSKAELFCIYPTDTKVEFPFRTKVLYLTSNIAEKVNTPAGIFTGVLNTPVNIPAEKHKFYAFLLSIGIRGKCYSANRILRFTFGSKRRSESVINEVNGMLRFSHQECALSVLWGSIWTAIG